MRHYEKEYKKWLDQPSIKEPLKSELHKIEHEMKDMEDRFYQYLSFGTGGMRGIIGAGTNRVNIFTIRRVAEGLAKQIRLAGQDAIDRGVVIAYDTRHYSYDFALETAKTIGKYGIKVYLFKESRPTPQLSFAIRYLNTAAGVVITASHNPSQYNGFKVYGEDGGQLSPKEADGIIGFMNAINDIFTIEVADEKELVQQQVLTYVLEEIDEAYQQKLLTLQAYKGETDLSIVYTPIHGAGLVPIMDGLRNFGFKHIAVVEEQAVQDANFSTVAYPNPEEQDTFKLAIQKGHAIEADLLLATDPDADRLGVAVRTNTGEYEFLTGNQLGALLIDYLFTTKRENHTLPENGVVMKSIVTSEFGSAVADSFGISTMNTLTGFKYIAEKVEAFTRSKEYEFLFGYEESYGYLIGTFVRDKDAVQAALLTAEMAAYHKANGVSLYEKLVQLYEKLGYYGEALISITLEGKEGQEQIHRIMESLRHNKIGMIADQKVVALEDYQIGLRQWQDGKMEQLSLPQSNVLKFLLTNESWVCIRPSGTEPKCKIYVGVRKEQKEEMESALEKLVEAMRTLIDDCCK